MVKKYDKPLGRIQCDNCGYYNDIELLKRSGACHLCNKIIDEKSYFKSQMNKKLRLWKGKHEDGCSWWNTH